MTTTDDPDFDLVRATFRLLGPEPTRGDYALDRIQTRLKHAESSQVIPSVLLTRLRELAESWRSIHPANEGHPAECARALEDELDDYEWARANT